MSDPCPLPAVRLPVQKLCDAVDFFDPRTDSIIRDRFRLQPRLDARLWEFSRAYDLLESTGALRPDARGISFGSGREVLLYAVANAVEHLTVTDIYEPDTSWREARADDPLAFVLAGAPFRIDPERLSVRSMDARVIDYPDESFDFAYSISAFEHFGDEADFVAHLAEVRRVLKPGGRYVLTTEVALEPRTLAVRGNYAFSIGHLLGLFREAGMTPCGDIDMRLTETGANEPRDVPGVLNVGHAGVWELSMMLRELAGGISAPVCFVLRAGDGEESVPAVAGLDRTIAWAKECLARRLHHRYRDWTRLNPFGFLPDGRSGMFDLHGPPAPAPSDGALAFCTQYVAFGKAAVDWRLTCATSLTTLSDGELWVGLNELRRDDGSVRALAGERVKIPRRKGAVLQTCFEAPAREGYAYALYGEKLTGDMSFSAIDVMVLRTP